ncbi:hypothetical protein NMY22_g17999 [Coprinellus aureogranulatus]|nr:hypothetical protein NMY22_g17999 [Coprinellus aureogranulatus]
MRLRTQKLTRKTPQLAADLAPPERRASAISVVLSGLLFGILIARVLSGVIAEFASWRVVYYFAVSVQSLVLIGAYVLLPSYPAKNQGEGEGEGSGTGEGEGEGEGGKGEGRLTYAKILKSMAKYAVTEPVLVQCTLVNLASAAAFANFWVTLTFLLGGGGPSQAHGEEPPYHYNTLVIGLFGLVGMAGVAFGPVVGYVIDRLNETEESERDAIQATDVIHSLIPTRILSRRACESRRPSWTLCLDPRFISSGPE